MKPIESIGIVVPQGMTPEEVARTFTAYLLGAQAFRNSEYVYGPFRMRTGEDDAWQLDLTEDFWLYVGKEGVRVGCRYEYEMPTIKAAVDLFNVRQNTPPRFPPHGTGTGV